MRRRSSLKPLIAALTAATLPLLAGGTPAGADTFSAPGFATETIASFPPYTLVGLAFAPDGRLFVWQKNGVVRVIKNGTLLPTPFLDLSSRVNTYDDRGFWGLAFDPNFATNGYVYISYTYESGGDPNSTAARTSRLSRVTVNPANPDVALAGSEVPVLGSINTPPCSAQPPNADCVSADGGSHTMGGLHFATDGTLYVGIGDGADASFDDPLSLRAQDLDSPNGKILRINTDGSAPPDNPYYDGTNDWRSRVWLYGVRNPFGFTFQPQTQELFFGDVGWNTWEEVDHGSRAQNFGWPCFEGMGPQSTYQHDYPECGNVAASSVTPPFYTYDHNSGSAVIGGPFYTGTLYPEDYQGNFFFGDYSGNFIKRVVLDDQHRPVSVQPFATDVHAPVGMALGPDGMIYYLSFTDGDVRRIRFNGPVADAKVTPTYGYSPLTVSFSSDGSQNPTGGSLTYAWNFGDGMTSTQANPTHTYTSATPKTFAATLTVTNAGGLSSTSVAPVTVGSIPPTPTITAPADGSTVLPGQTITYKGSATDADDGTLPASSLQWTVLLHHNTHVHTFVGGTGTQGSFVAQDHGAIGTFYYEVILTATDSSGLKKSTSVDLQVARDSTGPTAPTGVTATPVSSGQINLAWTASTDDVSVDDYRVERCQGAGCTSFAEIAAPSATSYGDTSVTASTSYRYRIRAVDPSGNLSDYSSIVDVKTLDPPILPAGLQGAWAFSEGFGSTTADITGHGNTATITGATWSTQGRYGNALSFNGNNSILRVPDSPSLDLSSAMTLSAWVNPAETQTGWRTIVQKQTDAYFLNASNSTGALRPSGGASFGGATDFVSGPTASPVGQWTHVAATYDGTTLRIFVNGTQVATKAESRDIVTNTNPLWIGGNQPYGEYFNGLLDEVRVYNRALTAAEIQTDMATPLAPSAPDNTPPATPAGLTATASGGTQVNLTWSASTDNVGVSGYRIERCTDESCTNFTEIGTSTTTSFNDTGLAGLTTYRYRIRASDLAGNLSPYSDVAFATTAAAADTTPPSAPTAVAATAISTTQLDLNWTASTDNVGVVEYRIERCSGASCTSWAQVGTSATTSFSNMALTANTTYRFRIRAADAAGNLSAYSTIISGKTLAADTTAPSAPTGLTATPASPTQVNLSWTASTDNVGVTGYRVERCQGSGCTSYAEILTTSATSAADTGLTASTLYRYRVRAFDAAGNLSAYSTVVNATTPAVPDTTAPSAPGALTAAPAGGSVVNLAWTASTDNVAFTGYRVERCTGAGCTGFAQIATTTATSYADTSVSASTTYRYRVRATDAAGNLSGYSAIADATTGTQTTPSGLVGAWAFDEGAGLTTADASGNGNTATINGASWTPVGRFGGALSFNGTGSIVSVPASASLNLTAGMTLSAWINPAAAQSGWRTIMQKQTDAYFLNASSAAGALRPAGGGTLGGSTVSSAGPTANPVGAWTYQALTYDGTTLRLYINGSQVASQAVTGAIQTSSNPLWIGGNQPYGEFFNGLIDEARVYNRALSAAEVQSDMNTSIVAVPADTTAPSAPASLTASATGTPQVDLSWPASTDNVEVTGYRVERCTGSACTDFAQIAAPAGTSFSDSAVAATTTYRYRVRAADAAGNLSGYSTIATATTPAAVDTTPPSAPSALTAVANTPTQVDLGWTGSSDNVGIANYRVERCQGTGCTTFAEIATPTGLTFSDTGRTASTVYRYRVRAADAAGNLSAYSAIATVTTPAVPDTTPPSAPSGLTATPAGSGAVNLSWTASTDNVGVATYRVERCTAAACTSFAEIATPTGTSYGDTAVTGSTTYRYRVRAADAAGNLSGYSAIADATTTATPAGLVGAWAFGEGSGTTTADASGNGNTATLQGATWSTAGKYGNALSFNGSGSIARVASSATLNLTTGMTLSAWIDPAASQSGWRTIAQRQVDAYFLNASNDSGPLRPAGGGTFGSSTQFVSGTTANPVNAWTHVALTYDGTTLRLYVNGTQVATRAQTGTIQSSSNPLWIGGNQPYGEFFNGLIDELRVYNRALSAAEVQSDMNTPINWSGLPAGLL